MTATLTPTRPTPFDPGNWGEIVDIKAVQRTQVPILGPSSWRPFPHADYVNMVERTLSRHGFTYTEPLHYRGRSRDCGKIKDLPEFGRFLSLWGIAHAELPAFPGGTWEAAGINSYDMSKSVQLGLGERVKVCSNGMIMGANHLFKRKHTVGIDRDRDQHFMLIQDLVNKAVSGLLGQAQRRAERVYRLMDTECGNQQARDIIIEAAKEGIIGAAQTMKVVKHWEQPEHPEFSDRNAWSLFNAFTSNDRGRNVMTQSDRFTKLEYIFDNRFFAGGKQHMQTADF